jgi:hypothetical protein
MKMSLAAKKVISEEEEDPADCDPQSTEGDDSE